MNIWFHSLTLYTLCKLYTKDKRTHISRDYIHTHFRSLIIHHVRYFTSWFQNVRRSAGWCPFSSLVTRSLILRALFIETRRGVCVSHLLTSTLWQWTNAAQCFHAQQPLTHSVLWGSLLVHKICYSRTSHVTKNWKYSVPKLEHSWTVNVRYFLWELRTCIKSSRSITY